MEMEYQGEGSFRLKYKGQTIPVSKGTKVDLDEETAKEFSKRKVNGEAQWKTATTASKKKKQKGDE